MKRIYFLISYCLIASILFISCESQEVENSNSHSFEFMNWTDIDTLQICDTVTTERNIYSGDTNYYYPVYFIKGRDYIQDSSGIFSKDKLKFIIRYDSVEASNGKKYLSPQVIIIDFNTPKNTFLNLGWYATHEIEADTYTVHSTKIKRDDYRNIGPNDPPFYYMLVDQKDSTYNFKMWIEDGNRKHFYFEITCIKDETFMIL